MVAVNHILKSEMDAPTLGLLVCKSKDNIQAKYAIESSSQPLGISEYELSNCMMKYGKYLPPVSGLTDWVGLLYNECIRKSERGEHSEVVW